MMTHLLKFALFAVSLSVCSASAQSQASPAPAIAPEHVGEAIARVHLIADANQRVVALRAIQPTLRHDYSHIVDRDIQALAALMSDGSDMVRHDAAIAIGLIGPRAAAAVPALQAALPAVDCVWADHNSSAAIIYAFRRIGVAPVRPDCPPVDLAAQLRRLPVPTPSPAH